MAINKTTEEQRNKIRRATVIPMPDRPSERGLRAQDIKDALSKPICGEQNSVLAELDRVVDEANADLAAANVAMSGKVPTTRKVNGHALDGDINLTPADLGLVNAYQYRGSVDTYAELPASGMIAGDVYNVVAAHDNYPAGTNFAWNGSAWDPLGGEFDTSDLQVKTGWAHDTSATSISYTMDDNKVKAFGASGITSITLSLPASVSIGYMSMVCVKHGSTPPTYNFVNNTGKALVFVQYGVRVNEYVPSANTNVRFMPSCVDGETIEMLILEISNE